MDNNRLLLTNLFIYVKDYEENDPKSHEGLDLNKVTAREVISKFGLGDNTIDFIGHALALHKDDSYLDEPAMRFVKKMKLYAESLAHFQGGSIHFMVWVNSHRLVVVYGGTYMFHKPECKVEFDGDGKAYGVTSEEETAKGKKILCNPSYLPDKVGRDAHAICIMSHPILNTSDSASEATWGYLLYCSYAHNIAPKIKYISFVSTEEETDHLETELQPGIKLLGPVDETFFDIYDRYEPTNKDIDENCYISTSYDATIHFESTVTDVIPMYSRITWNEFDLTVDLTAASAAANE
ncbi:hypothetical protein MKX03_030340 [Papaver bracteatum]|nr:hypothetical protein MKX03_030340 [Papaver bracteatum]